MSDLVKVGNYADRLSAELAQGILDMGGVESYVQADDRFGTFPAQMMGSGGAYLIVRAEDADRAAALLQPAAPPDAGD